MRTLTRARLTCAALLIAAALAGQAHAQPTSAQTVTPQPPGLRLFTLDRREAAKGETVSARFQLTRPAKSVSITATSFDGAPLGFQFPQTLTWNTDRTEGLIAFTVPTEAGSLSPLLMMLSIDNQLRGLTPLRVSCDYPWFFTPRAERCPFEPVAATPAAIQRFERGMMIWLKATGAIWVLYAEGDKGGWTKPDQRVERYVDAFVEGSPESDPAFAPPEGKQQPIRGFGLVWRTKPLVRHALGWALEKEQGYTACFGASFGGGKSMRNYISTPDKKVLEIEHYYEPTRWRELDRLDDQPVVLTGCDQP